MLFRSCTVFTPRHPQTKPKLEAVLAEEKKLDVEGLIRQAMEGIEVILCRPAGLTDRE